MTSAEADRNMSVTNDLSFLWLEITAKCNLFCSHCYAESGPRGELYGNMAYPDWARVLDEAAALGCRRVQFIGGEPTMHPRLQDLVDHANHRGFWFIEVFTNATRIDKQLLGCFRRNGVCVATSFYSDDPVVHEQITQGKGSWQRTVRGIERVRAAGLPLRVGVIETERNVGHGPRAVAFLKSLGVRNVRRDRERGVGRGKPVRLGGEGERYEELCGQCWKGMLCVTSGGDVYPCVFSRATRLGDVRSGLSGVFRTAKLTTFRRKVRAMYQGGASGFVMCAPESCAPKSCAPESCAPKSCAPESCAPKSCAPEDCDP
jgi:MoaA/NifB/PqqE/SkfB family radical SAM enzyme